MNNMATPKHNDPFPGSHRIYNFGYSSLVIIATYVLLYMYLVCLIWSMPGSRKDVFKRNNIHFNCLTLHNNPSHGSSLIYYFSRPFLPSLMVIISIYSVCLIYVQEKKRLLKQSIIFTHFTRGEGLMKLIRCFLTRRMLPPALLKRLKGESSGINWTHVSIIWFLNESIGFFSKMFSV